ncbi:hypothetical protein D9611_008289 [Ephemerocybe angulata]|uniref:Uncharacterized protein n=1 Tax=Ephemerocybe angulata TaxID=980116 RepID=A0A8H5BIY5_9AGAR|nr:hypothetical protein D9611_008289 [Tulosesus angulatus]
MTPLDKGMGPWAGRATTSPERQKSTPHGQSYLKGMKPSQRSVIDQETRPCDPCPKAENCEIDACCHSRLSFLRRQTSSTSSDPRLPSHARDANDASAPASVELSSCSPLLRLRLRTRQPVLHHHHSLVTQTAFNSLESSRSHSKTPNPTPVQHTPSTLTTHLKVLPQLLHDDDASIVPYRLPSAFSPRPLRPFDYTEGTDALISKRISARLKAHQHRRP